MRYLICLGLVAVTWISAVHGQTVDTAVLGTVLDPGGALVSGAAVTVLQPSTGLSRTSMTSPDGTYEIRYLVPGEYVVEIRVNGFRGERRTGVVISKPESISRCRLAGFRKQWK
jgi:protocatechuate 3,4-dioxygenase beta subunit